jgi:two-component system, chemotaxis family, response regulator Rcp1
MNPIGGLAQILLVEDSPTDVELTVELLRDARVANELHVARDGEEALAFLRHDTGYEHMPHPDLILLDLNLPKIKGHGVLQAIKNDPKLKVIPVIVLTSSNADSDVLSAYRQHANAFVSKPLDVDEFTRVVRSIEGFWLSIVRLPSSMTPSPDA